jgi:hypothetical protein
LERRKADSKKLELPEAKRGEEMTNKDKLTWDGVEVTARQVEYLVSIESWWKEYKHAPSIRELAVDLDNTWAPVKRMVDKLYDMGLVTFNRYEIRTLRTTRMDVVFHKRTLTKTG